MNFRIDRCIRRGRPFGCCSIRSWLDFFDGIVFFGGGVVGLGGAGPGVVEEGGALGEEAVGGGGAVAIAYGAW
jgi:hypothetical protein